MNHHKATHRLAGLAFFACFLATIAGVESSLSPAVSSLRGNARNTNGGLGRELNFLEKDNLFEHEETTTTTNNNNNNENGISGAAAEEPRDNNPEGSEKPVQSTDPFQSGNPFADEDFDETFDSTTGQIAVPPAEDEEDDERPNRDPTADPDAPPHRLPGGTSTETIHSNGLDQIGYEEKPDFSSSSSSSQGGDDRGRPPSFEDNLHPGGDDRGKPLGDAEGRPDPGSPGDRGQQPSFEDIPRPGDDRGNPPSFGDVEERPDLGAPGDRGQQPSFEDILPNPNVHHEDSGPTASSHHPFQNEVGGGIDSIDRGRNRDSSEPSEDDSDEVLRPKRFREEKKNYIIFGCVVVVFLLLYGLYWRDTAITKRIEILKNHQQTQKDRIKNLYDYADSESLHIEDIALDSPRGQGGPLFAMHGNNMNMMRSSMINNFGDTLIDHDSDTDGDMTDSPGNSPGNTKRVVDLSYRYDDGDDDDDEIDRSNKSNKSNSSSGDSSVASHASSKQGSVLRRSSNEHWVKWVGEVGKKKKKKQDGESSLSKMDTFDDEDLPKSDSLDGELVERKTQSYRKSRSIDDGFDDDHRHHQRPKSYVAGSSSSSKKSRSRMPRSKSMDVI